MIQELDSAIDDIQSDLDSYKNAEQHVRSLDSHLDENYLKGMLNNTNQMIRLIEQKIKEDKKVVEKLVNLHFDELAQGLAEIPGLEQQLENMKQLKHDYKKKIQALQTFASSTNSLFTDSLQAFKYALQGVDIINQSTASSDGAITFPAGSNMGWAQALSNQTLDYGVNQPDYSKIGKGLKDLDEIKKTGALTSAYFGKTGKGKNSHKLKDLTAKKVTGNFGSIELIKLQNSNSILSGKQTLLSNTKFSKGTSPLGDNVHIGENFGGSSALLEINTNEYKIPIFPITASGKADFSKTEFTFYNGANGRGAINVGGSAALTAAEAGGSFNYKIPGIGKTITIGGSASWSLGASGHITSSQKDGFSLGFKLGLGPGGGFSLKIK